MKEQLIGIPIGGPRSQGPPVAAAQTSQLAIASTPPVATSQDPGALLAGLL